MGACATRRREDYYEWSGSATLLHSDLTKAPFWLPPVEAERQPRVWKAGVSSGPKLWADRASAEAEALRVHGQEVIVARRRLALEERSKHEQASSTAERGAVLLLHGAGDSGAAIASWCMECGLGEALASRQLTLHSPDAPWRPFSPAGGETWRVWFDRNRQGDKDKHVEETCSFLSAEAKRVCPAGGVLFVVGFSQGGSAAFHGALRSALDDLGEGRRLGGECG